MTTHVLLGLTGLLLLAGCATSVTVARGPVITDPAVTALPAEVAPVAALRNGDTVTGRILMDGIRQARAVPTWMGDGANCSADLK